jgi:hypothetical protein
MKFNIENVLAEGMEKALNSDENKKLFSNASVLEKLAFKRVSEEDATTEIETELINSLSKTASCKCNEPGHKDDCECDCHKETKKEHKHEKNVHEKTTASYMVDALLKISADLDEEGFDKLAAASLILADRIVVEAKAKKEKTKSKSKSKSSKEDKSKEKTKAKGDVAERMKKMREMQGKKDKKDSKKSEKK